MMSLRSLSFGLYFSFLLLSLPAHCQEKSNKPGKKSAQNSQEKRSNNRGDKKEMKSGPPKRKKGFSPKSLELYRDKSISLVGITDQVSLVGGTYWFGTEMEIAGKLVSFKSKDGAEPKKKLSVKSFMIDIDCVTNKQFEEFVEDTGYITDAEQFGWSFVLEHLASPKTIEETDKGLGRVKDATHWMAVSGADWKHPFGPDTSFRDYLDYPVVQISHADADEYCSWVGRRLPTEIEWEYAARGGRINETYSWGNEFSHTKLNIWEGKFPSENLLTDGYKGPAPVRSFEPNGYGLYNMLGNVWEWCSGGTAAKRILRGGSYLDSVDGSYNHAVMVSTRQMNGGDSGADNIGFRCVSNLIKADAPKLPAKKSKKKNDDHSEF